MPSNKQYVEILSGHGRKILLPSLKIISLYLKMKYRNYVSGFHRNAYMWALWLF